MQMVGVVHSRLARKPQALKIHLGMLILFLMKCKGHLSEHNIVTMVHVFIWGSVTGKACFICKSSELPKLLQWKPSVDILKI